MALHHLLRRRANPSEARAPRSNGADAPRTVARTDLARALAAQRRIEQHCVVVDIQLLLQVIGAVSYASFREEREAEWRKHGERHATGSWPAVLPEHHVAILALPLAAGRVSGAPGRDALAALSPLFTTGLPGSGAGHLDACLSAVTLWVSTVPARVAVRLAPPLVEIIQGGRATERRAESLGQAWPLPAPDRSLAAARPLAG